mmetsp:Transcript_22530/g.47452  ORF Transcript_22530/g.47452 Transcript_22530/m.47452 type:complete len:298 (-) Transcript_22530:259-1152(-)
MMMNKAASEARRCGALQRRAPALKMRSAAFSQGRSVAGAASTPREGAGMERQRVPLTAALRRRSVRSPCAPSSPGADAGAGASRRDENGEQQRQQRTSGAVIDARLAALGAFLGPYFARARSLCAFAAGKLGLSQEAARKQAGNFSMMASVGSLTSKFCVYDPTPTTPVDTFILLCKALANFLAFYTLILFVRVLLTWFPNIDWDKNPWLTLRQITDPYLNIFRNIVPPLMGQIDLTPIVGFLVMQYITAFIKFLGNRFISIDNFSDGWGGVFFFEDEDMLAGLFEDQNAAPTAPPA